MYAYTQNNPVMYSDISGEFPILITMMIVGFVAGATLGGASSIAEDLVIYNKTQIDSSKFWLSVGIGAFGGLISGGGANVNSIDASEIASRHIYTEYNNRYCFD